ncbi:chemotaxis protein CheX [Geobacter sp. SVR]|uniref:chemotaxis protein CheX n=1 Tax=Geobacter sp. SVR TaxID=2495594 RepID=UPI00143F0081|nr:chemotaxis protein CheX [Geobacter sp. SVR]BCS55834.1 chemotaxis protein CheX [Geobacter sp. SVR]GCF83838.1 chemotaxis protein CheX [Geobacter sp. SVR]
MSLNAVISSSTKFSEEQLAKYITDATREVFSTMVMMEPTDDYPLKEPVHRFKCSITGMVGFAGIYSGVISIHCPVSLALKITSSMLGMDCEEVNEDLSDAIGEIANMLGGGVKQVLSKGGLDVKLSIPTVISGEEYTVNSLSDIDCVIIPFVIDDDKFLVGLTLKKED